MQSIPFGEFRFRVVHELGAGGLGRVDEIEVTETNAFGKDVGTRWARKRLNSKWAAHPEMQIRFEREISALQTMSHPNIVTYEGENLLGAERFYVMPVYDNSLRTFIKSDGKRGDWRFAAEHGAILARALAYAHRLGFIHRDLKPDNILYKSGGQLTITDWGLGYFVHRESKVLVQLTRGGMGTEYYCSIEQWATGKCDGRGDIYSLGMTLDELYTGRQRTISVGDGVGSAPWAPRSARERRFQEYLVTMTARFKTGRSADMATVASELRAIKNLPD